MEFSGDEDAEGEESGGGPAAGEGCEDDVEGRPDQDGAAGKAGKGGAKGRKGGAYADPSSTLADPGEGGGEGRGEPRALNNRGQESNLIC